MPKSTHEHTHLSGDELDALIENPTSIDPKSAAAKHLQWCVPCFGDFLVRLVAAHPDVNAELHFEALAKAVPSPEVH